MLESLFQKISKEDKDMKAFTFFKIDAEQDLQLEVDGFGDVNFPLNKKDMSRLIKEARLASFGLKEQTIVDTRVRNVWEISPNKITTSKKVSEVIKLALNKIKTNLDIASTTELSIDLHNLLIYEPGQFFKNHQDTEKKSGMIGTMVLELPSPYTGGDLSITHGGKTFKSPPSSNDNKINITAFYSDCFHEVKKVKTGHRVTLTYNIYASQIKPINLPKPCEKIVLELKNYFFNTKSETQKEIPILRRLSCLLDHQYSQKGLNWGHLKGSDRNLVGELLAAAKVLDLELYLGQVKSQEVWSAYDKHGRGDRRSRYGWRDIDEESISSVNPEDVEKEEIIDESCELFSLFKSNGQELKVNSLFLSEDEVCLNKSNSAFKPVEFNYEGYMGNYGNTAEYWYSRTAVVLWPKVNDLENLFVVNPLSSLTNIKNTIRKDLKGGQNLFKLILPFKDSLKHDENAAQSVLEVSALVADESLAKKLLTIFNFSILTKKNLDSIHELFLQYGEPWALEVLKAWFSSEHYGSGELNNIEDIIANFSDMPKVTDWLLGQQYDLFIKYLKSHELNSSKRTKLDEKPKILKRIKQLLSSAKIIDSSRLLDSLADQIKSLKATVSGYDLGSMVFEYEGTFFKDFRESLKREALNRLRKDVKAPDLSNFMIHEKSICRCRDCEYLNIFLASNTSRLEWPLAAPRRQHIHTVIEDMCIGVKHITKRSGSPYKLMLTKSKQYFKDKERLRQQSLVLKQKLEGV